MKRLLTLLALACAAASSFGATLNPVQLLNPAGSSAGQTIVSTGASTAPGWATVPLSGLSSMAANTVVANATSSTAAPTAFAMPGCSATGSALNWTTNTGFTCQTGLATLASPTFTGTVTVSNITASGTITGFPGRLLAIQIFTSGGTYTPTTGANRALVEVIGAGGGSGGSAITSASQLAIGQGGNGGAYGVIWIASALSSQTVAVGTAGSAGAAGGNGGAGGTSSFGTLISCAGGNGGAAGPTQSSFPAAVYYNTTAATCSGSGTFVKKISGSFASPGVLLSLSNYWAGAGGISLLGSSGVWATTGSSSAAVAAGGYGSGASGAASGPSQASALVGAAGAGGVVIVYEYQ